MKWSVILLVLLLLPAVGAVKLIIPDELNTTISVNYQPDVIKPFRVYEGDWPATLAHFQVQNDDPPKDAYLFAWTSDPKIVTLSRSAELLRHIQLPNGTNNYTLSLYGVNLGRAVVTYGVLYDLKEPQVYNGYPQGKLKLGTRQVNMTVYTDEDNVQCRYSEKPFVSFRNMKSNLVDNGHWHNLSIKNLRDNTSYAYYVKCWQPINWSYQGNKSSFIVNVTCIRDGWCSPGLSSKDNDISYMYLNTNSDDYLVNFSVGHVYPPPPVPLPPAPPQKITIEMPVIVPVNISEAIKPPVVPVNNSKAAQLPGSGVSSVSSPDPSNPITSTDENVIQANNQLSAIETPPAPVIAPVQEVKGPIVESVLGNKVKDFVVYVICGAAFLSMVSWFLLVKYYE